jgi:ectoine hydroxylase-related dioxygenase (phytanoyl-CoA dioxygenase family)
MSQLDQTLQSLDEFGYAVAADAIPESACDAAAAALDELDANEAQVLSAGQIARSPTQTVIYSPNVVDRERFHPFVVPHLAIGVAEQLLEIPFLLSSVAASRSEPDAGRRPHLDGRIPIPHPSPSTHLSVIYCLDEFRVDNGATMFWPYSHMSGRKPPNGVIPAELPGATQVEASRGSAIFFLGSTWHEIAPNLSGSRRWSIIVTYCRWWVKPTTDFSREFEADQLDELERDLYGVTSQPPGARSDRHHTVVRL